MEHALLGVSIRHLRKRAGISAMELATRAGVSESAIRKVESGDSKEPSFRVGVRIAKALGVSAELLAGEPTGAETASASLPWVLRTLREHRSAFDELGVRHASVFGSVARGEEGPESDVDILVDVPARGFSLLDLSRVALFLESVLHRPVDLATTGSAARNEALRDRLAEAVNAF